MCVTNIAKRRNVAMANTSAMVSSTPSLISQRLMDNFMPLMLNTTVAKPLSSTSSTYQNVGEPSRFPRETSSLSSSFFERETFHSDSIGSGSDAKDRPKRRRKPQKPGKTAKQNDRHFVVHNYHDHSMDPDENDEPDDESAVRRGGCVAIPFPAKLHSILDQVERDGLGHVVSWQPHGRCFVIHKPKEFSEQILPHYFCQSKLTSFQRQLNLYGFCRLTKGRDCGGYYHELFLRSRLHLTKKMQRTKIKGTKFKAASSPEQEPDFYKMPFVRQSAHVSDDSSFDGSVAAGLNTPPPALTLGSSVWHSTPNHASPSIKVAEPFSVQLHQKQLMPSMELCPLIDIGGGSKEMRINATKANTLGTQQFPLSFASSSHILQADDILDQAVDELFDDLHNNELEDGGDFDNIWDMTEFGEDARKEDLQLGYMLDRLLGN